MLSGRKKRKREWIWICRWVQWKPFLETMRQTVIEFPSKLTKEDVYYTYGVFSRGENHFFILRCLAKKEEENYFSGENDFPPYERNYFPLKSYVS